MTDTQSAQGDAVARRLGLDRTAPRRRRPLRWLVAVVLVLAAGWALLAALGEEDAAARYETQEVRRGDLSLLVTATGNLQPTNQVDVGIEVSGTIATVEVDYNDEVDVGQVLARLDRSKLEAQVERSEATLNAARARVAQMQATLTETGNTLERLRAMHEKTGGRLPAQQDLDAAEAAYARTQAELASARAAVAEAQATLNVNRTDLEKAVIRSPIKGVVLVRAVEPGQTVAASFQSPVLFTLAEDLTQMELHVDVDEADVGQVRTGQAASFTVDAYPQRTFPAQVTQVRFGAQEVAGVITYKAVLKVDNAALLLRPGMTATADILVNSIEDALLVPNAALRFRPPAPEAGQTGGGSMLGRLMPRPPRAPARRDGERAQDREQSVWVLRDGVPTEITVSVGVSDGQFTQVVSGDVQPGMRLLTDLTKPAQ